MLKISRYQEYEDKMLAPYATRSSSSKGRVYKEPEHTYRSAYQRDRERIIHCTAFRRLEYKTQVFVNHEGDYYRTRLTHTLEVAQIARSIARALKVNEDLVEAIALAHDLGHTPFGHSGEDELAEIMKDHGGFNHNLHGLRVVDYLEKRYPEFDGLNLTWEVREGIIKHSTPYDKSENIPEFNPHEMPTLETQIVDVADEIAYDSHDLDDGITSELLHEADLMKVKLWAEVERLIEVKHGRLNRQLKRFQMIREIINLQVTDLIETSLNNLNINNIQTVSAVKSFPSKLVCFNPALNANREELRQFLYEKLYQHYRVIRMASKARRFIKELFDAYITNPRQLPPDYQELIQKEGPYRVVCDYVAGMTDRYALDEHKKLFEPYEKV